MQFFSCPVSRKRMRVNLKIAICLVIIGAFFTTVSYWTKCGGDVPTVSSRFIESRLFSGKSNLQEFLKDEVYGDSVVVPNGIVSVNHSQFAEIDCVINGEYTVACRRLDSEVYVPFTFLHKYFEVYGKIESSPSSDGVEGARERFEWQHSYSKYFVPKGKYNPKGLYMKFDTFNVEARERVKCISAMDGVPVSSQWDVRGYLYPIQIAQFALSHFSKNKTESGPRMTVYEDGHDRKATWSTPDGFVKREWDDEVRNNVMHFKTTDSLQDPGISLPMDQTNYFVLNMNLKLKSKKGSLTIIVEDRDHRERYYIHYVCNQVYISTEGNHIYYGMGSRNKWGRLTRDIAVDLFKGIVLSKLTNTNKSKSQLKLRLLGVVLRGEGSIDNLTLSTSEHVTHFLDAAEWLLKEQDNNGGWSVPVERKFNSPGMQTLAPGWYSAMAQGQAMSVLTRAYHETGEERFLEAALRAAKLFTVNSEDRGVVARFMDKYVWYEEYPTVPGSFVLNGFIYSLIGLYDLKSSFADDDDRGRKIALLYEEGMKSLKILLPFYDSGTGSFYDLRHFTVGITPNVARWDYHSLHIGQLLLLSTIDDEPIFRSTSKRWIEYMKGKRAPHN